ncbi:TNF receptor-associated factor 4-like isoform X2 [Dendronephthya gigantea]|uniref:TNF receptor-associated factor 4-like isoform X2 n=1 Tax=Dendronephthya gigantea TaxID=151771 RepID=UPI00106B429A|nr:TNF receptor-associated factor 4-like isoform X2 [Dendronephthya gigantea]
MATIGNSGHPLKWFKDQNAARNLWECAICLEVLKDPVQIRDCGHQFCELCIEDILKVDPRCPTCRIDISGAKIFEDQAARRMINQLDVNCCNEGCSWMGCLTSLLQDHQNACKFLIRSADNVNQLDVGKLEKKLETLMMNVFTLEKQEKKHEEDIKELKLKHETELKKVQEKHETELKKVQEKNEKSENELKQFKLKHDEEMKLLGQKIETMQAMISARVPEVVQQPSSYQKPEADYIWQIPNFTAQLVDAIARNSLGPLESEDFFSSHGYKMRLTAYLNEGARGCEGYMGVYVHFMKSDRDDFLPWPFKKRFTFVLLDKQDDPSQRRNVSVAITPKEEKKFQRPTRTFQRGQGRQKFVLHSTLETGHYIRDDTVYIMIVIDP